MRVWADAFRHRHSPVTPEAALNAALIRLDAYEKGTVSDATRRALIKLDKVEQSPSATETVSSAALLTLL